MPEREKLNALDVEVFQLKEREEMTPTEAWRIISANLMELYKLKKTDTFKGYTDADIEAEIICFKAVNRMQKGARGNEDTTIRKNRRG